MTQAYGFNQIFFGGVPGDGRGTTIAIVDAFDDPSFVSESDPGFSNSDLHQFDLQFGLPDPPSFRKVNQTGGTNYPSSDSGWASEIALDVEWAHAMAPMASILLVEATDNSNNLFNAVGFAARQTGVVAVSMSWGGGEDSSETSFDSIFTTPSGHPGVTYVASSGDSGAPPIYPAISPNVLSVGGTHLNVDGVGNYSSEYGWAGSGGGISFVENRPSYQSNLVIHNGSTIVNANGKRSNPDVAYDADPYSGVPVYDSFNNGSAFPWSQFGGTSIAAPQWSALIAIVAQGRGAAGPLDGRSQTLPNIYQISSADYHDITSGGSSGNPAYLCGPGYDLVTGLGTPFANSVVTDLVGNVTGKPTTTTVSSSATSPVFGQSLTFKATVTSGSPGTLTGTVQFKIDGTNFGGPVTVSGGMATSSATSSLTVGSHTVTALYSGDSTFAASNGTLTQIVSQASTTTVVGSSQNPSTVGQPVTFTATTSVVGPGAGTPTGTVIFYDGSTSMGQGTLTAASNGIATASFSLLSAGTHTIKASYGGDSNFINSSGTLTQTANAPTGTIVTTTSVSSSDNTPVLGESLTLSATVSAPGTPTGTVIFLDGATTIGQKALSGSPTVTLSYTPLTLGNHTIVASYTGDNTFAGSTSSALTITINKANTNTVVVSSGNPIQQYSVVTFTATVTSGVSGIGTPTGMVQFSIDGSTFVVNVGANGTASYGTSNLAPGSHTVLATYLGDSNFASSIGGLVSGELVTSASSYANSSTTVVSSLNPSLSGQSVTFTATVNGGVYGTAFGTVTFFDGFNILGQANLASSGGGTSMAALTTSSLGAGSHVITASYGGGSPFKGSKATLTQTVNSAGTATTTGLSSSHNSSVFGQSVSFTAVVTPQSGSGTPTGTVQFMIDGSSFGNPVTLSGGTATSNAVNSLSVTGHTILASYSGDPNFTASTGSLTQTVNAANTSTSVSASPNPSVTGQTVTFTATVAVVAPGSTAAANPTGTVTFLDGGTSIGTGSLSTNGGVTTATLNYGLLLASSSPHTITASYSGDTNFLGSSGALSGGQTVNKPSTNTGLGAAPNPSTSGQTVTLTATVTIVSPGTNAAGNPTGTVTFKDGSTTLGSATLTNGNGGVITFSTSFSVVGNHTLTATYAGDGNFQGSSSAGVTQTVNSTPTATTTVASSGTNPSVTGQSVTFMATVTPTGATGTVTFLDGGTSIGTGVLATNGGTTTTTLSYSKLLAGKHTIQASYLGDATFAPSSGSMTQTVNAASTNTAVNSTPNPSASGQMVTFTATVTVAAPGSTMAANPTGTVAFVNGGATIGTGTLSTSGGATTATFTTATLPVGNDPVTASYLGDSNFTTSTGAMTQTLNAAGTSTAVGSSPNPSTSGQNVTFTATVTVVAPGSTAAANPTGTVTFQDAGVSIGTGTLSTNAGVTTATYTTSTLSVGNHSITASYGGDSNFTASSGSMTQTVNQGSTSTIVEDFEHGLGLYQSSSYNPVGFAPYARTGTYAKHDGANGLDMPNYYGWIYRGDMVTHQGQTITCWVEFPNAATGRAYFGFGSSANGTYSVVLAPNTSQLLVQYNSGFISSAANLAAATQFYQASHWYQVRVIWANGGGITAQLYDSDGATLLSSTPQITDTRVASGGIAFLSNSSSDDKYFDTVTVSSGSPQLAAGGGNGHATAGVVALAGAGGSLQVALSSSSAGLPGNTPTSLGTSPEFVPLRQEVLAAAFVALPDGGALTAHAGRDNADMPGFLAFSHDRLAIDAYFASITAG
jgi:hypothetical protein